MSEPAEFISVAEAARQLGISDDLAYELVARGTLPALVLGRRKVVPRRAIDLVVERALDGFDPDALAGAVGPASAAGQSGAQLAEGAPVPRGVARGARPSGTAGAVSRGTPRSPRSETASVVALRR